MIVRRPDLCFEALLKITAEGDAAATGPGEHSITAAGVIPSFRKDYVTFANMPFGYAIVGCDECKHLIGVKRADHCLRQRQHRPRRFFVTSALIDDLDQFDGTKDPGIDLLRPYFDREISVLAFSCDKSEIFEGDNVPEYTAFRRDPELTGDLLIRRLVPVAVDKPGNVIKYFFLTLCSRLHRIRL